MTRRFMHAFGVTAILSVGVVLLAACGGASKRTP
jgi:hypothetical protein